jgi:murein DD-endopeptidase MepM/ murein hydrolase activator NlpD
MKLEYKVAVITTLFLIALGAGSIASALQREPVALRPTVFEVLPKRQLIIPIDGIGASQLVDSWGAPRTGHLHQGIDIMAPKGTPVHAVADGTVAKLFTSKLGGTTLYQFDATGGLIFYYAHLSAYAPGLKAGDAIQQGQLIGYVGSTGNATVPHLHFEIQHPNTAKQWWKGAAFNPYYALKAGWTD